MRPPQLAAWAAELAGTAVQLGVGFSVVALVTDPSSPLAIAPADLRLALVGLTFGVLAALVAVSPAGRRSGAHLNPAVTLAFWLRGRVRPGDLAGYAAGQTAGALVATAGFVALLGRHARAIGDAVTMPAPSVGALGGAGIEAALTFALLAVLFATLSSPETARWTPLAAVGALTVLIWAGARLTGASLNPARSLAPAIVAGRFDALWVYVAGPVLGAALAALAFGVMLPARGPVTTKLCGSG